GGHLGGGDGHCLDHRLRWALCGTDRAARALTGEEWTHDAIPGTTHYDQRSDDGLWEFRDPTPSDLPYPAGGDFHYYGRQRLWQEHTAPSSHWAAVAGARRGPVRWAEFLGRHP